MELINNETHTPAKTKTGVTVTVTQLTRSVCEPCGRVQRAI